jgi:hypothetical protein
VALAIATTLAIVVALWAARETLRRRIVFLLGRRGNELAPALLLALWLCGLLLGEITRSLTGMAITAAMVLVVVAQIARRKFAPVHGRHRVFTRIDWFLFTYAALIFWFINLWDFVCHRAIVARYLQGNIPPSALNDPRLPLAYHSIYDAMVGVALQAFPVDLEVGLALASILCLAVTLPALRTVTRLVFRSPLIAQLGRVLFIWGFGPTFIRYFWGKRDIDVLHGDTGQAFANIILRRPAGLGYALFMPALALILACYKRSRATSPTLVWRAADKLIYLLPVAFLMPQLAEEATFHLCLLLLPLLFARRLPWRLVVILSVAALVGMLRSGVLVSSLMGYHAMPVPRPHFSWPPMLPTWKERSDGVTLWSSLGIGFFMVELGPIFLISLAMALWNKSSRRRLLAFNFLAGAMVAFFVKPSGWPKSDLDRFFFYGTPFIFMLSAAIVERLADRFRRLGRGWGLNATAIVFVVLMCGTTVFWPTWNAGKEWEPLAARHSLGGDLARNLTAVGPREPILTTVDRADELVMVGFTVIAPFTSNDVATFSRDGFDEYVAKNARRAVWLFLPEGDARVAGRRVEGRDRGYVLVRAGNPPAKS